MSYALSDARRLLPAAFFGIRSPSGQVRGAPVEHLAAVGAGPDVAVAR